MHALLSYLLCKDLAGSKDMAVMEAENHREMWENEIKSKSKLGLRVSNKFCLKIFNKLGIKFTSNKYNVFSSIIFLLENGISV